MMIDLKGQKFNRLTVIGFSHKTEKNRVYWKCKCDCGKEIVVRADNLRNGHAKSCGCYKLDQILENPPHYKHGQVRTRLYRIWCEMYTRCYNSHNPNYSRYGGRGISICDEWQDFANFYSWAMANGYQESLSIDRINNDGNYEPSNCRWATKKEQANNTSRNRIYYIDGEHLNIRQISEKYSIDYQRLWDRLRKGWDIDRAAKTPIKRVKKNEISN